MQDQEVQAFESARTGQDIETLQRELAGYESALDQLMDSADAVAHELVRLMRERQELWTGTPESDETLSDALQAYDQQISALVRQREADRQDLTDVADRARVLRRMIASSSQSGRSDAAGYDIRPPTRDAATADSALPVRTGAESEASRGSDTAAQPPDITRVRAERERVRRDQPQTETATPTQSAFSAQFSAEEATGLARGLGERAKSRVSQINQQYAAEHRSVAPELSNLSKTVPPSLFAFLSLVCLALCVDIIIDPIVTALNLAFFIGVVVDLIITGAVMLCIRAMINRSLNTQRLFGLLVLLAVIVGLFSAGIGLFVSGGLVLVVAVAGIRNKGIAIHKTDKEKVGRSVQRFVRRKERAIKNARMVAARLLKAGRKSQRFAALTRSVAKSTAFKAFSKGTKTTLRLLSAFVAEFLPIISLLPFNTISVWMTYRDLKRSHLEARELLASYEKEGSEARAAETDYEMMCYELGATEIIEQSELANPTPLDNRSSAGDNRGAAPAPARQRVSTSNRVTHAGSAQPRAAPAAA